MSRQIKNKICLLCKNNYLVSTDNFKITYDKLNRKHISKYCLACISISEENKRKYTLNWKKKNKEILKIKNKEYRENNKEKISVKIKEIKSNNRDKYNQISRNYLQKKRDTDIFYKLRKRISKSIRDYILTSKDGSCLYYLSYTINDLKQHLESQFESWMNWSNWGRYNVKTWNDNDPSTWTWQIDHIIPHSCLPYDSMTHENFKKCWDLSNLRPLSAKQNIIDGTTKIRHK